MIKTKIIAAFCGTGKTYLHSRFNNLYRELDAWEYQQKGVYPDNYVRDILHIKHMNHIDHLLIATDTKMLQALHEADPNIEILLVYPEDGLRNEYLDRYLQRDSSHDFIGAAMKYWQVWLDDLKKQTYCTHHVLSSGQYLFNAI